VVKLNSDNGRQDREIERNAADIVRVEKLHEAYCIEHGKLLARIPDLEHKLDTLMGQTDVYFRSLDKMTTAVIHSPEHKRRDELGDKLVSGTLTCREAGELLSLLQKLIDEETNPEKRFAAAMQAARVQALIYRLRADMKRSRVG
jgi:hypothetical protein